VLRQGLISPFLHGLVGYVFGAFFVAAPFLFGFDSGSATAVSIVTGVASLIVEASSELPTGLAKVIPVGIHVVLDFLIAAVLIAAPFLFGFSDEEPPTAVFIVGGVLAVLITIATRFLPPRGGGA
jgi:hypothetical protein